jgi:integrase
MSLYKRPGSSVWYVRITDKSGKVIRESTGTENKQLATQYHDELKLSIWKDAKLGIKADKLFEEFVPIYFDDKTRDGLKSSTLGSYEEYAQFWIAKLKGKTLRQIDQDLIVSIITANQQERKKLGKKAWSNATTNRHQTFLHGVLTLAAKKYRLIEFVPAFFMNKEPKCRVRHLAPDEIGRLIAALPKDLQDIAAFSFATGFRQSNAIKLRWDEVDLVNKMIVIEGEKMKNGHNFGVPIPESAIAIIQRQIGKHDEYVFTSKHGKPRKCISSDIWKAAKERAGIEDFRWHDIRHTWASTLAQSGVPDSALMALGSWETPSMVRKYAHLNTESVRHHAAHLDNALSGVLTKVIPSQQSESVETSRLRLVM